MGDHTAASAAMNRVSSYKSKVKLGGESVLRAARLVSAHMPILGQARPYPLTSLCTAALTSSVAAKRWYVCSTTQHHDYHCLNFVVTLPTACTDGAWCRNVLPLQRLLPNTREQPRPRPPLCTRCLRCLRCSHVGAPWSPCSYTLLCLCVMRLAGGLGAAHPGRCERPSQVARPHRQEQ